MLTVLTGLLAISGLAALMALLLEVADSYFGFYGEVELTINKGDRKLTLQGGGSLLSTLMGQSIFIPSACGGRGSCGYCKVKVTRGAGPVLPTETPYLEPQELKDNVRLSCQIKVRGDMDIEIPPELFLIKEFRSKVMGLRDLTDTIKELKLKLIEPAAIEFKPGQYIQFQVPEYEGCDESVYRAYSVASAAGDPGSITLIVTKVPEGLATTYIHEFLKEGDEVIFNGPYGDFYLRDSERDIFLVATGSGMAPIMSLLQKIADEKIPRRVVLVFGARHKNDLFYLEEIRELKKWIPSMEFFVALSKPPEEGWDGEKGRVTDVLRKWITGGDSLEAYICGNPAMVESVDKLMQEKGVPADRIFYDKFG